MKHVMTRITLISALSAIVMLSACHKKVAQTTPPPPPPAAPTASLVATPQVIESGQSSTLSWETANANEVSIEATAVSTAPLGAVEANGSQQVTPTDSTTYTLYAKGPGGTQTASVRVTVTAPPPPPPPAAAGPTEDELFARNVKDVYFDFDASTIRADQQSAIDQDAAFLSQHPNITFIVEGNCDERGSIEYNLALGDERATGVQEALIAAGVSSASIKTVSYGKEKPVCNDANESCWQQNRRDHFNRDK